MKTTKTSRQVIRQIADRLHPGSGCTDGGCVFGDRGGMHTNGGCECLKETDKILLRRNIMRLSDIARTLAALVCDEDLNLLSSSQIKIVCDQCVASHQAMARMPRVIAVCTYCNAECEVGEQLCRACERGE